MINNILRQKLEKSERIIDLLEQKSELLKDVINDKNDIIKQLREDIESVNESFTQYRYIQRERDTLMQLKMDMLTSSIGRPLW